MFCHKACCAGAPPGYWEIRKTLTPPFSISVFLERRTTTRAVSLLGAMSTFPNNQKKTAATMAQKTDEGVRNTGNRGERQAAHYEMRLSWWEEQRQNVPVTSNDGKYKVTMGGSADNGTFSTERKYKIKKKKEKERMRTERDVLLLKEEGMFHFHSQRSPLVIWVWSAYTIYTGAVLQTALHPTSGTNTVNIKGLVNLTRWEICFSVFKVKPFKELHLTPTNHAPQ